MRNEFATADTEAETAPEADLAASPSPLPLPEGAQPVDEVKGYHALIKGSTVTVFGPDGAEIASATRRGYNDALVGRVGDTRLVSDGIGDRRLTSFAELAARHHRAVADPRVRDRAWVRWEEDGVAAVYGTDKYDDDDLRAVKAGNLYWSGQRQARATGRKWNPGTRDRNLAAVLKEFARQDRNIVVLGPGQTPEDLAASPTPATVAAAAAAVPAQQTPPAAAPPVTAPEPEPEPEDLTGLSYEDLVAAEDVADTERSRRYTTDTTAAEARYHRLLRERGRRLLDGVATAAPVTELGDEDLAAESEWWQKTIYKTPFHSADESYRTLERRRDAVTVEQNGRTARTLMAGPVAADLDDETLESAYEQIGPAWTRLPGDHELHEQVTAYRKSLQEERAARRARSYSERTPVGEMTLEELVAESVDLGSHLAARNEQSAYSNSEAVKEARAERLRVVDAEWHQRGLEQNPDAARAALGQSIGGKLSVLIDGSERTYGYVERQGKKFRALANYDQRSSIGDFDSRPGAMAALVQRYGRDPETLPRRTWGNEREVDLPSSSYDPLVSWLRRRPSELSREYDRVLTLLTPYQLPTQTKVLNPLTNQVMRAYPFHFEEGLLGELTRIAERTTEDLREQSLNEQLPKREREAAKRRIPAMGAALIGINAVIEQVRAAGGDVERRGVDQGRLAAQMAALAGTVDEREGGETDGDEQPVRDAAAAALGGVPAPGAGGDGGPGEVLPDAGDADERGDRRGGGGPGGGPGAGDGLPGPGRADGADLSDGAGAGPARDAAAAGGRGGPGGAAESGSGGAGGDPQGAGEPVATRRFRADPADLPRGPLARAEANLEAVKLLRTLEGGRRGATVEEKRILARWSGWGSVPTVFLDEPDPDEPIYGPGGDREGGFETDHARWESYSRVRGELRELLNPFEWRAASRAVLSAHYTPQAVAEAMWQGLAAYGFDGGEVLEAGFGSGVFCGVAPPAARLTGVELDPTTAAIAGWIYPHANVLAESFAETDVPLGTFDAVIGNVPFSQAPFGDRRLGGDYNLHNGFIIKQLALLRPGAYMAVITSRWTLDGEKSTPARRTMARWGDLAAAYRMPRGTFGETGDTDVVADVLVFRRRAEGEEPGDQSWVEASERELGGHTLAVNAYFTEHPENVLGRMTSEQGPYGPRVTVQGDPDAAPRLLRERMEASAAAAVADGLGYTHHEDWPHREPLLLQAARVKHATDFTGRLYTDEQGQIWQHVNGADPVRVIAADGVSGTEQLRTLLSLRDTAGELQELDRTGSDPDRAREVRGQLARLHTAYTAKHGPLSRPRQTRLALPTDEAAAAARDAGVDLDGEDRLPTGWGWFRQDPHAAAVLGLEHWDRANDRAVPSEVLTRRPGARRGDLEPTDDPKTALTAVMGAAGRVDLPLIASLLDTTAEEARLRLGTEVFDNPVTKKLEHAGAYLSGPVRQKLEQAREAAATDPTYAVNVAALDAVQPPPKRLGQFTAQLGAHWIPAPLVQGFLREYLGDPTLQVSHNERYGWSLAAGKVPDATNALKGTERRSAVHIAKALLGRASMVVNQLDGNGVDEDATRAMRYKADAMRSAFEDYCTASTARVTVLTDAYNRQMNGHVVRSYDNLAPTLAGFTTERTPHPWQLSGAARMQFERGVILAHEMGLGKTTTMVMGSQALKASGQIGKPFAVVQPGLGRQWLDEAKLLYPNADIHLITSDDLADGKRRPMLEWLRANAPDLVIFTEGAFGSIRMSPEQQELFIFRELESLKEQLERERGIPHNAFALMKLEQRLATVEARIRRNDAPMRTPGEVYWDGLGFDYACIDEAHRFTAIGFRSKEAGGDSASVRGVDLHQKLTWHHQMAEYDGGRPTVTLGTGTPMENSIFEQYSCLELGTPWLLDQFGVHGPDLWSETFGQKVQRIEQAPDGSGLTIVERFSRFVSKSTMKTMWGLATDTKTGDEVGIERPKVAGGAPELVLVEPTADQSARLLSLVARGQAIHAGDVPREEDNMLAVSGEGRAVALDPRLIDANAPAANKLVEAADIIAAGYHAHKDHTYAVSSRDDTPHPVPGGLFFVFCNSGTPGGNNKGDFDAYAELRDLLGARDVPRDLVQFAQEHRNPEQKAAMTDAANNGGIAVLMGSSEVLGTGFNGQNRAYALMHLDQDWTPAMMMQRNARALRPGNQHEEVSIYFLATKGSMDAWQVGLLTSKAEGLRDIQRPPGVGDDDGDTVEEIGASDWDYATMAAEIGGNPYMRQFMEAKVHLQGLEADRRNAAADRVRQTELLGIKEGELVGTRLAIAARDKALPKITETIRGDAFHIRIGGREFDQFGEAAPVLRQVVTEAVRAHQNEGIGAWKKLGTFGGLDFAVRPEILPGSGEVRAYIGFPELRHSKSRCSVEDLVKANIGATMLGRLATALEKAEDHQLMDRERLPGLEKEVAVLTAQQEAVNYGPAIEHARRRVELLDGIVGAITERDKIPELTESMLDPKKYPTENSRKKALQEHAEKRAPHQANVDAAAMRLATFDAENPAPEPVQLVNTWTEDNDTDEAFEQWRERQRIIIQQTREAGLGAPVSADEPAPAPEDGVAAVPAPDAAAAEPTSSSGERAAGQAQAPEPGGGTAEPEAETTQLPGDGYGTADLYEMFGLTQPERVPAPAPQDEPEAEAEESAGVSDGQMTVEEVQPEAAPDGPNTASLPDNARERLTSADGLLAYTLWRPPPAEEVHADVTAGWQRTRDELAAQVDAYDEQMHQSPQERADQLARWRRTFKGVNRLEPFQPLPSLRLTKRADAPGLTPAEYGIGSWVTWRDEQSGQQVTGQVMSPGAAGDTWYVSTDRTGHTGEYHVLSRSGKKATGYTHSVNGAAADLRPTSGPGEQLPLEDLPQVDSVPARPVTSYADWLPTGALARVREPIPVTVGEMGPRFDPAEVAFDVTADGISFVVKLSQNDKTLTSTFVPRVEADGQVIVGFLPLDSRALAVDFCVSVAREAREGADKPLYAHNRNNDFTLAPDGVCGSCSLHIDDNDEKELYQVNGGDPECVDHTTLHLNVPKADVIKLARARRIWATRVTPESAAADDTVPPADAEPSTEAPAEQQTATQVPHEVARETLQGGDRITAVVNGSRLERSSPWGQGAPDQVRISGTLSPGYRDYRGSATLLDAVIRDLNGNELAVGEAVFVSLLPARVTLLPTGHRAELQPEKRTVGQIRVGDLIAEGGTRGEVVTELRFVHNSRRGSMMTFSTRDVASGTGNGFTLAVTDEVAVVPRERRPAQDVATLFAGHGSHRQVASDVQRTFDLHAAVADVTGRVWPNGDGPQDELRALNVAIGAIDPTGRGVDAYRANAAAMEGAEAAAAALFTATDDDLLNRYVGMHLHPLRQHLDTQAFRLYADAAHLAERAAAAPPADASTASTASTADTASTRPGEENRTAPEQSTDRTQEGGSVAAQGPEVPSVTEAKDTQELPLIVSDEYSILYAAFRELMPAEVVDDGLTSPTSRIAIGEGGVHADGSTIERLVGKGLLEYGTTLHVSLTKAGRQRIGELERAGRDAPAVGDRVLLVGTGDLGIVGGYRTNNRGFRYADVVCEREGWPDGWDTNVDALFMTTVEPAVIDPEAAAEQYRVAALRQFPGTLTDPALRGPALGVLTAAALADPQVAQAARANDLNNFVVAVASWTDKWLPGQWEDVPPGEWPDWVRAYFREGDDTVRDLNDLYADLAGPLYERLRTSVPQPAPMQSRDLGQQSASSTQEGGSMEETEQLDLFGVQAEPNTAQSEEASPDEPAASDDPPAASLPVVDDAFSLLSAADKGLLRAPNGEAGPMHLAPAAEQDSVVADADTVRRLVDEGALQFDGTGVVLTGRGRRRLQDTRVADRPAPAVGDRVLIPATGHVGVVGEYTESLGLRYAQVVVDRGGWATSVYPQSLTILEPGAVAPEAAAELYRTALPREQTGKDQPTPDAPEEMALPDLDVVLLDVDVPLLDPAEPYATDADAQADIDRLGETFAQWAALPAVQRYYDADRQQRPDGNGDPTNPVAQLAEAYGNAARTLREGPAGSPDDLVRQVHTVAAWSAALEPVVGEDLRGPLRQMQEAASLLTSRSRATVESFEAELAALAANSERKIATEVDTGATGRDVDAGAETRPEQSSTELATDTGPTAEPSRPAQMTFDLDAAAQTETSSGSETEEDETAVPEPRAQEPAVPNVDAPAAEQTPPAEPPLPPQTEEEPVETAAVSTTATGPSDAETTQDTPEESTMATPPVSETTDAPSEPTTEEPPAPQRYFETVALAGDSGYRLRLSGLDGQPVDSGGVLRGDLVIATIHPGPEGGWFARLAAEGLLTDVTYLADAPEDAAAHAAVMYSAFTGAPYGPPPGAAIGDKTRQRVDVLRTDLRDAAVRHRDAVASAAARAYPDFEQNEHFRELVGSLDGLAAAVSDAHGSQQMTQYLDGVQGAVSNWGGALPVDPGHPERRQLAFPLAHLLHDSRRLQNRVRDTLAAVQAERAAVRDQAVAAAPRPEVPPTPAAPADTAAADTGTRQDTEEFRSPEVPDSQTLETTREEAPAAQAGPADAPSTENSSSASPSEEGGAALDAGVDGIRRALDDALQASQSKAAARSGELPLWTGAEASLADTAVTEPSTGPLDVRAEFQSVLDAWDEHVPSENGTAPDLVADLGADLDALQRAFAEAVAPAAPAVPPATVPAQADTAAAESAGLETTAPTPQQQAVAVNAALQQADTHTVALQDLPEWQKIQTVRGAVGHLFRVMKERAGEHFDRLMGDHRVGNFFRRVSISACEKVAQWAQAGADRLRRGGKQEADAPAAGALQELGNAASAYASPGGGRSGPPPASWDAASAAVDVPSMRRLGEALARPLPGVKDGRGTHVSTAAARGKSTTRRGAKKPSSTTEQPGHLRRGGTDQQQTPKPKQR